MNGSCCIHFRPVLRFFPDFHGLNRTPPRRNRQATKGGDEFAAAYEVTNVAMGSAVSMADLCKPEKLQGRADGSSSL